ncbi:MAG: competence/damage-inducible protein A [Limnochordales bacterium]|nr:competence/damage-inducible protein A [Limnochordales bacterium]
MEAEIISVGTELLLGEIADTNAVFLANQLADLGIGCRFRQTVGDNLGRIAAALRLAAARADLVIASGGLGPTADDLTRAAIAAVVGRTLAADPVAPYALANPVGTAPGLWVEADIRPEPVLRELFGLPFAEAKRVIFVALPGPPAELEAMWRQEVLPRLQKRLEETGETGVILSRTIRLVGIGEAAMEARVRDLVEGSVNPTVAPYAGDGECRLRLTAKAADRSKAEALIAPVEAEIRRRLGEWIYGADADRLESVVGELLRRRGERLAVAESCTGGMIAHYLTSVPGSSDYFERGYVTYSNRAKQECLGVPAALLVTYGAVSEPVARAMAEGARRAAGVEWAVATTGIAGPGGGTAEKPVGLVYIAVSGPDNVTLCQRHLFRGDRRTVQRRTTAAALDALRRRLLAEEAGR